MHEESAKSTSSCYVGQRENEGSLLILKTTTNQQANERDEGEGDNTYANVHIAANRAAKCHTHYISY